MDGQQYLGKLLHLNNAQLVQSHSKLWLLDSGTAILSLAEYVVYFE